MTNSPAKALISGSSSKASGKEREIAGEAKPRRLAIAFFYDGRGIIDDYMLHLVRSLHPFVEKTIFVSNGPLSRNSEIAICEIVDKLLVRENVGFDVWGYKAALEMVGYKNLAEYDEVILYNHTFFGPIYPFSEMFDVMEKRSDDFWGISSHKAMVPNPFTGTGELPLHLNSHFIAIRRPLLTSQAFQQYWETMPEIASYIDSVLKHESRFTEYFSKLGYRFSAYVDPEKYGSAYPVFIDIDETIADRSPIFKRRILFHDPLFHEENAINVPRALKIMRETSDYDQDMIWSSIGRSTEPRILATNAALTRVLPEIDSPNHQSTELRIAVCAHIYYVDMIEELLSATKNIPEPYDFIATTDTEEKRRQIESIACVWPGIKSVFVIVVKENRGRDMSALFIASRAFFLDDRYDLVCRIHTKLTPQISVSRGNSFKHHMFDNLLASPGYVRNVIDLFEKNSRIGLAMPPLVHISYPTQGYAWFANKSKTEDTVRLLDLNVPIDADTPVAAYGTMFWFRPQALRKLFAHPWKWTDFNAEPNHVDGGLAHALERTIGYATIDAGYIPMHIMSPEQASHNYSMLEYKFQKLMTVIPNHYFRYQLHLLREWKVAGHSQPKTPQSIRISLRELNVSIKRSLMFRSPKIAGFLQPIYRVARNVITLGRR